MMRQDLLETLERLRRLPREAATVEFKSNWERSADTCLLHSGSMQGCRTAGQTAPALLN